MELNLGPEIAEYRTWIRDWIKDNAPDGLVELADWRAPTLAASNSRGKELDRAMAHPAYHEWERRLLDAKLICPAWPVEYGGGGLDAVRMAIFVEECYRAGVPRIDRGMGESLVGPTVIARGTDEQKAEFLPPIISGEHVYCQGFSEPNHGSDLAAVETRGEVDGDEIVITGQKVWTSGAMRANHIFILCRTDPDVPKHRGLSWVISEFGAHNNVDVRPLRQMTGASEFCEDFFDGMRAPLSNVIGGLHNGWQVAMTTLGHERGGTGAVAHLWYEREFWELVELARKHGVTADPTMRQDLAWAYTQVQLMKFSGLRLLAALAEGREPGPEASITKVFWSEYHQKLGELATRIMAADALVRPEGDGYPTEYWHDVFLSTRAATIYSGSNQIQRNIIGERVLGLPKELRVEEKPKA